jgi:energy-coupling factor transporter ATP-binding protein EcfA2
MRISSIRLCWFRGAGKEVKLVTQGASLFVFGQNGDGKSSFVDAIELCIADGKVAHLSHEYSGRFQEKGLVNTHRPAGAVTCVEVAFEREKLSTSYVWAANGAPRRNPSSAVVMGEWDYRRTILRQEEVAQFIRETKTEKYSALVPLLGLQPLENAAENLRRIGREIVSRSGLDAKRRVIEAIDARRRTELRAADFSAVLGALSALRSRYLPVSEASPSGANAVASAVVAAVDARINSLGAHTRTSAALQAIASSRLLALIGEARALVSDIASHSEPLIKERLEILNAAAAYSSGLPDDEYMECPACGSKVAKDQFQDHVGAEKERLQQVNALFSSRHQAIALVCTEAAKVQDNLMSAALAGWRTGHGSAMAETFDYIAGLELEPLRTGCTEADLGTIEHRLGAAIKAASQAAEEVSPDVQELIRDKASAELIEQVIKAERQRRYVEQVNALVAFSERLEEAIRDEIRERAQAVFGKISGDIQRLWNILRPRQYITEVRLHTPKEADKAIDVALNFHGIDQASPRLTLSEGQRNALGLCIFLAMAKQDTSDRPIVLDDVVISMDRDHRSLVATLLEQEFSDRQIILLTHEREWFFELSRFLRKPRWNAVRLMPWAGPNTGIRIAEQPDDFAKARANILSAPEDAESNVRRLMDQSLAEIAEKLKVPMPFLRGDRNDHRTAGEFIGRITGRAKKALKVRRSADPRTGLPILEAHSGGVLALERVAPQLAAWANRATHTFSSSPTEAEVIIDNCEAALGSFSCQGCHTDVWYALTDEGNTLQCRCGDLVWKL